MKDWQEFIFSESETFEKKARRIFAHQLKHNAIYRRFCEALGVKEVNSQSEIPLLPIQAFKDSKVVTDSDYAESNDQRPTLTFESSGTGGMSRSRHYVMNAELYRHAILKGFRHFYNLDKWVIWGYTPGYSDNPNSSLIWMINELIKQDSSSMSCFLPLNEPLSKKELQQVEEAGSRLVIFGAAFGLLDLSEISKVKLPPGSIIIETGGMKTYRREISRKELHQRLSDGFGIDKQNIHSEYGMAELLSQAYATGGKWFRTVPWMQVSIRDPENPSRVLPPFYEGLIGIVDLANVHSCAFILTEDKGVMDKKGRFQVLGRWNPKDLRGCNFLIDED